MNKRKGKKKPIGKKGKLFWDEGASKKLIKPTQDIGFKVETLTPQQRNQQISDATVLSKIIKNPMPVVTYDYTSYKETVKESKATGFIEHEGVSTENFEEYVLKWTKFLKSHTSTTLSGFRWKVPLKGDIKREKLNDKN